MTVMIYSINILVSALLQTSNDLFNG